MLLYIPFEAFVWIIIFAVVAYFVFKLFDGLWRKGRIGQLTNRYVLVTGCDSGLGYAIAKHLDAIGVRVFAACLTETGEKNVKDACSTRIHTIRLDVTDHELIKQAADYVKKEYAIRKW